MRIRHLNLDNCQRLYDAEKLRIEEFVANGQRSWFFHASVLVGIAKTAYAIGNPISECRGWIRQATEAYRELFRRRGEILPERTNSRDGQLRSEEAARYDGYTSADSFDAACAALAIGDFDTACELVLLAGDSPSASLVSRRSEICTSNEQTISHALNALLRSEMSLAEHEAAKLRVRRTTKVEQQIGLAISAIATGGDVVTERDGLLFYHNELASEPGNQLNRSLWISMPALALSSLAVQLRNYSVSDLATDCVYCPLELLGGD